MYFDDEEFKWSNVGKALLVILIGLIILALVILMIWFFAGNLSVLWIIVKIIFWIAVVILGLIGAILLVKILLWGLNKLGAMFS